MNPIQTFIKETRKRLNFVWALKLSGWLILIAGFCALAYAGMYRVQGEAVPRLGFLAILGYVVTIGGVWWYLRSRSSEEAARIADEKFELKDSLSTSLAFEGKEDGVYLAQQKRTEELLSEHQVTGISLEVPRVLLAGGGLLAAVAIWLGFLPASEAVQKRQALEAETENRTEEIQKELEEMVDEILEEMDDEEKEVLNPHELKQWVKELKRTNDQKEALRQLARFEQKISKAMAGLEAKEDEESLKMAAAELSKSDQSAARQLGKKLDLKEYKLAEEDLKKAAKKAGEAKKAKDQEGKKLTEEELKKMREMTKRMADAARKRNQGAKGQKGKVGKANAIMGQGKGDMAQMMEDLDDAAREAEEALEEMDGDMEEFDQAFERMEGEMEKFNGKLRRMHGKNQAKKRLAKMRSAMSRAQSYAMGQSQALGLAQGKAQGAGGLKPGVGSSESRRNERDELKNNQNYADLKGQMGEGPSVTALEDAESGTGVSGRTGEAKAREFQRQMESFVRRDDVPEDVKMGVKEYFERVHEVAETKK